MRHVSVGQREFWSSSAVLLLLLVLLNQIQTTDQHLPQHQQRRLKRATLGGLHGLGGQLLRCFSREGEPLNMSRYSNGTLKDDACVPCYCRNGTVECSVVQCDDMSRCPVAEKRSSSGQAGDKCCPLSCRKCSYAGLYYESGYRWLSSSDPCRLLTCKAGVVTMSRLVCKKPACSHPIRLKGSCCPACPGDALSSGVVSVRAGGWAEAHCEAEHGVVCSGPWCSAYKTACPVLDCRDGARQHRRSHYCCPECERRRVGLARLMGPAELPALPAAGCTFARQHYAEQQSFSIDKCTNCICENGFILCRRFTCEMNRCPVERLFYDPRFCCPLCREGEPLGCRSVSLDGRIVSRKHEESWSPDHCTHCNCSNGKVECVDLRWKLCHLGSSCPRGYKTVAVPNRCCPRCVEEMGRCTVRTGRQTNRRGGLSYQTFDGRRFRFNGTCQYLLSRSCQDEDESAFRIIVRNRPRKSRRNQTPETSVHRLTLVFRDNDGEDDVSRISLMTKQRVKVNGRRVARLPYVKLFQFKVFARSNSELVVVLEKHEVQLEWHQRLGRVRLLAEPRWRSKICGLCGDYNRNLADDFTLPFASGKPNGHLYGQLWRVGGIQRCLRPADVQFQKDLRAVTRKGHRRRQPTFLEEARSTWSLLRGKSTGNVFEEADQLSEGRRRSDKGKKRVDGWKKRRRRQLIAICGSNIKLKRRKRAVDRCALLLKSELFSPCRRMGLKSSSFFRRCVEEVCSCPSSGRCYCEQLRRYSSTCRRRYGLQLDWRSEADCQIDKAEEPCTAISGAVFSPCVRCGDRRTCEDVLAERIHDSCSPNTARCRPACKCRGNAVMARLNNGRQKCVPAADCNRLIHRTNSTTG